MYWNCTAEIIIYEVQCLHLMQRYQFFCCGMPSFYTCMYIVNLYELQHWDGISMHLWKFHFVEKDWGSGGGEYSCGIWTLEGGREGDNKGSLHTIPTLLVKWKFFVSQWLYPPKYMYPQSNPLYKFQVFVGLRIPWRIYCTSTLLWMYTLL